MTAAVIPVLLLASTGLLGQDTPSLTRESYRFHASDISRLDVNIAYVLGTLNIESSRDPYEIKGTIEYGPRHMKPDVDYRTVGSKGKLDISVKSLRGRHEDEDNWSFDWDWKKFRDSDYESEVDFRLPETVPIDLDMDFGLGEANIDLSHLAVSEFTLNCGLSDVRVSMETANPVSARRVTITSGLGDFNATELGNLKARKFRLEVGLGAADIDFSGEITDDMEGEIEVGLGSLDLTLPGDVNVTLRVERTFLSSVDVVGLIKDGDVWITRDWIRGRPTIDLEVSVGLGSVDVTIED